MMVRLESVIGKRNLLDPGSRRRRLALAFLLSFLVRALLAIPVVRYGTPPKFDEQSYFRRAEAFERILKDVVRFRVPQAEDRDAFYEGGGRPPFQSVVLSLGLLFPGAGVGAARFMMVLFSALTTGLILLVTERLAGPRAGLAAAALHLVYPSFLAFSHYLWAETTFIFLLFLSLHLALLIPESREWRRLAGLSTLLGVTFGCLALTRSVAVVPMVIILAWILGVSKGTRAKMLSPVLVLAFFLLTILPWEYTLFRREHKIVPLANNSGILFLAHNPWRAEAEESPYDLVRDRVHEAEAEYARERSVDMDTAARKLALREITSHFGTFLAQCGREALFLWSFDSFPVRHVVNAVYPLLPGFVVLPLVLVLAGSAVVLYLFVLKGLMVRTARFRLKVLLLALVAGGAAPYVLTFGNSRYNLPQIALLLPIAGFGLAFFREKTRGWVPLALLVAAGSIVLFVKSYPGYISNGLRPSSVYSGPIGLMDRVCGARALYGDEFFLEDAGAKTPTRVTLTLLNEDGSDFSFYREEPVSQFEVVIRPRLKRALFVVYAHAPRGPLKLRISPTEGGGEVVLTPTERAYWDRSRAIGLGGLRLMWRGGR
jgi:4-amino-4-deoxy-L-arabinose transferase-like glycosyltransferase